jgi:hypothetical protein
LDATGTASTGALTATVTFHTAKGGVAVERVSSTDGAFRTRRTLGPGETADVTIRDQWGDYSTTAAVPSANGALASP